MNMIRDKDRLGSGTPATATITTKTGEANPAWEEPVSFPEWHEILALEPLDALKRERFGKAIICYLRHCRDAHAWASIAGAKRYLEAGAQRGPLHREALRWFLVAYACHGLPGNRRAEPAGPLSDAALAGSTEARRGTATPPYNGKAAYGPFDKLRVPSEVEGRRTSVASDLPT
jgi:hypothetical protein